MKPVTQEELFLLQLYLAQLRLIFGIDHDELAKYLGLSKNTVKRIENLKSRMTKPYYYAIIRCFEDRLVEFRSDGVFSTRMNVSWYVNLYRLFTTVGKDDWEKRRIEISKIIFGVSVAYKKREPEYIKDRIWDALHENGFKSPLRGLGYDH